VTDEPINVLIVDDHPMFRAGLAAMLASMDGIAVVGQAADGQEAIDMAREVVPDVVVMDLQMPGINGTEATRVMTRTSPHLAVLVLTMFQDDDSVFAAMRAGARGYLLKGADEEEIVRAIQALARGEAIFGPEVASRLIEFFTAPRSSQQPADAFPELTDREREVLELIAQGRSNTWIAQHFVLSPKTVRNHVSNIFAKLRVADRAEAIVRAREAGMGQAGA
jgi:DNA-binding NarL/FixJ family response regulator